MNAFTRPATVPASYRQVWYVVDHLPSNDDVERLGMVRLHLYVQPDTRLSAHWERAPTGLNFFLPPSPLEEEERKPLTVLVFPNHTTNPAEDYIHHREARSIMRIAALLPEHILRRPRYQRGQIRFRGWMP